MLYPPPDPTKLLDEQDTFTLYGMCIWGEGRGCSDLGKLAIANVVGNRLKTRVGFGSSLSEILLRKNAFSAFNSNDVNYIKVFKPLLYGNIDTWQRCCVAASIVCHGFDVEDPSKGATFYHDSSMNEPPDAVLLDAAQLVYRSPQWGVIQFAVRIGRVSFYRQVPAPQTHAA